MTNTNSMTELLRSQSTAGSSRTASALEDGGFSPIIKRVGPFIWWIFAGFGLIPMLMQGPGQNDQVVAYSVHRSFFLWLIILTGFVGSVLVHHYPRRRRSVGMGLSLRPALYLRDASVRCKRSAVAPGAKSFCSSRSVPATWKMLKASRTLSGAVTISAGCIRPESRLRNRLSWLLLIPWIMSLFHTFSRGRTIFSPNTIEEWHLGVGSEVTDRTGMKFRSHYRDSFETLLGLGAGDIEAVDPITTL